MIRRAVCLVTLACHFVAWSAPAGAQEIRNRDLFAKTQKAAQQALEFYGAYDNPAEQARLTEIGYRIAQESTFRDFPFTFYLVDLPEPNAFALPGGQIFLTRGMLDLGLSDDMLAGLLGHEIGHVVMQHGTRIQRRATLLNVLSTALLAGVIIGAARGDNRQTTPRDPWDRGGDNRGDVIQGTAAAGMVVTELLLRSYSREFEDEADDEGQRLAAAAGFDPDGTRQLMDKMRAHLPESRDYGYWRTHPFFEDRVRAATVRRGLLKIQEPEPARAFRAATQKTLVDYVEKDKPEPPVARLLEEQALLAWPQGELADRLRIDALHAKRDGTLEKNALAQDLGGLVASYRENLEEVRRLTPESPLIATLEKEIAELEASREALYPTAGRVFEAGIFETEFLETFLSNFPDAPERPAVALALGDAHSRLGRQVEAVRRYLEAWEAAPESEAGRKAIEGLRNLAPSLDRLGALEQLARQDRDPELQRLAAERLAQRVSRYEDLANGAEHLRRYPDSEYSEQVASRLNSLADKLYGEVVLYQTVGDHVKGSERIQKILTYAPQSPAAERLRQRMVLES